MAKTLTLSEFKVDLQDLRDAADAVQSQATIISEQCNVITQAFNLVAAAGVWNTPASATFVELQAACTAALDNLNSLLTEMVSRMRTSYQNYHDAELANFNNYSTKGR
jgi:WXG100 family type VII secretion target